MISKRKFYKTTIQVEVLSEEPFEWNDLDDIHYAITDGDCSGRVRELKKEVFGGKGIVRLLKEQGSDPEFFGLNDEGEDLEEEIAKS